MIFGVFSYGLGLSIAVAFALTTGFVRGDDRIIRAIMVLLLNWVAGMVFVSLTGWTDCWPFNIIIDASASVVILWRPAGKMQALLGVSYCVQIAMHGGYGAAKIAGIADPWKYYNALTAVAWIQLLMIGGWSVAIWGRGIVRHRFGGHDPAHPAEGYRGLAEP